MKNKLSLFITLALATVMTTGCDAFDKIFKKKTEEPTEQKQEQDDKPTPDEPIKPVKSYYFVSFDANGGSGTMEGDRTQKSEYITPRCEFYFEGHTFYKWALNSIDGEEYEEEEKITGIEDNITLYALWIEDTYTVSFNANGGTGTMASVQALGEYTIPKCEFVRSGHTFSAWAFGSASGVQHYPNEKVNIDSDVTLYAIWTENTIPVTNYTVTFNANGGTGTMASQQTTGDHFVVPECSFTRQDYEFKNWAYESKNGVEYRPGEVIKNIEKDITLYALWQEKQPEIPDDPNIPAGYYSECANLTGSALQAKLKEINPAKNPSYDWSRYEDADEAEDDSNSILCIYTRHNIPKSNHCGNYAWDKWNREHIWTQSAYPKSASDNHNIFACEGQINNYRGNKPYAEGGSVVVVFGHTTECKQTDSTFEPCDAAKGEVARSVMYGTVMYTYTMTNEIESIELALKWHLEHAVTTRETKRNNTVYGNQGNRNPFVDHPEYACKIWGTTNAATRQLCGM